MELLSNKYKEVKTQKNVLKKEVIKLMNEIKEQEQKLANSQATIQSISNFFNNNTLVKLNEIKKKQEDEKKPKVDLEFRTT